MLLSTPTRRLLKIKGFSEIKVEKIKEAGKKMAVSILIDSKLVIADMW